MRRFREIKDFGLRRLPTRAITFLEVGALLTFVLFPPFGIIKGGFILGIVWKKNENFRVLARRSSPRRRQVRLGEGKLRLGEGLFCLG